MSIRDFFGLSHKLNTTEFAISEETAETLSKALTTLRPGDRLEIQFGSDKVVISITQIKVVKKDKK